MGLPVVNSSSTTSGCKSCSCGTDPAVQERLQALETELAGRVSLAAEGCSKARHTGPEQRPATKTLQLKRDLPLPLMTQLSRHEIDGKFAWVAVETAGFLVVNRHDDELLRLLSTGYSPAAAVAHTESGEAGWPPLLDLIGRLASNGFIENLRGHIEQRPNSPRFASRFHLTQACQLECIHCYADSSPHIDRTGELPLERWQQLLDDFASHGGKRILFTGGEALMYKGCIDLLRRAKQAGLQVTLLTNGILVPRYLEEIHETVFEVQVSLDGPTADANDRVRGSGTFPRILKAIDLLAERGTTLRVGMSVMAENWEDWKAGFLEFAKRYQGMRNVELYLSGGITSWGRGASIEGVNQEEVGPVIRELRQQVDPDPAHKITRFAAGCGYFEQLVVGPWGHVYPCHLMDGAVAHIDDHPYEELLRVLEGSRDLFSVDHIEGCKDCDIRYLCGGSCRVIAGKEKGTRLITDCTPVEYHTKLSNMVHGWYGKNAVEEVI
jgi:radical SAM protein with 4Fe4S-binding SPASM domain